MIYETIFIVLTCCGFFLLGFQIGLNKKHDKQKSLHYYEKLLKRDIENMKDSEEFQMLSDKEKQTRINEIVLEYEMRVANEYEDDL